MINLLKYEATRLGFVVSLAVGYIFAMFITIGALTNLSGSFLVCVMLITIFSGVTVTLFMSIFNKLLDWSFNGKKL